MRANNPYGSSYRSACIADSNRYYQYVVMSNVAEYGGSGVFAPMRLPGARQVVAEMGKNAEGIMLTDIDLPALRRARAETNANLRMTGRFQCKPGIFGGRFC